MTLADIVSVSGIPGLHKLAARRNDGLIVTGLTDDKTQFVSGRNHLFTTLDNVTLYTTGEPALLKDVLKNIKAKEAEASVPDGKDDTKVKEWFGKILPEYDKEKVYVSDMKKLAKWYGILNGKNLIEELTADVPEEERKEGTQDFSEHKDNKHKVQLKDTSAKSHTKPAPAAKKITTPRKAS